MEASREFSTKIGVGPCTARDACAGMTTAGRTDASEAAAVVAAVAAGFAAGDACVEAAVADLNPGIAEAPSQAAAPTPITNATAAPVRPIERRPTTTTFSEFLQCIRARAATAHTSQLFAALAAVQAKRSLGGTGLHYEKNIKNRSS